MNTSYMNTGSDFKKDEDEDGDDDEEEANSIKRMEVNFS